VVLLAYSVIRGGLDCATFDSLPPRRFPVDSLMRGGAGISREAWTIS
jgi:hypothetical protein